MEQILVLILILNSWISSGVCGQYSFTKCSNEYCYFSDGRKTRSLDQARTICYQNQSWPLEIHNAASSNFFRNFMTYYKHKYSNIFNTNKVFLNMKKDSSSWIWLNKPEISVISVKSKDNGRTKNFATLIRKEDDIYEYEAFNGSTYLTFICQKIEDCSTQETGKCYYAMKHGNSKYIYKNWFEASNECLNRGMTLATFESMTETQIINIIKSLRLTKYIRYWIGLIQKPYKWVYKDTFVSYSNWRNRYPDDTSPTICPHVILDDGLWSLRCQENEEKIVVCMKENPSNTIPSSKTSLNPGKISFTSTLRTNTSMLSNDSLSNGAKAGIAVGCLLLLIAMVIFLIWKFKPNFKIPFSHPKKPRLFSKSSSSSLPSSTVVAKSHPIGPIYAEPIKTTQPESLPNLVEYAELEEIPSTFNSLSTIETVYEPI